MKFTPEVIAAIQTLRDNADNDFELHRIDVLERDLTAPPQVEVIDDTHQRFDGVTYRKDKGGHYCYSIFIHRAVWQYYIGEILDEHSIHHIDGNKGNSTITNLQIATKSEHGQLHYKKGAPVATVNQQTFICEHCGKKFVTQNTGRNRFCSQNCRNKHRHRPSISRICPACGETFISNVGTRKIYCSSKCGKRARRALQKTTENSG